MIGKICRYWSSVGLKQRIEFILASGFVLMFIGGLTRVALQVPEFFFTIVALVAFMYGILQFIKVLDDFANFR